MKILKPDKVIDALESQVIFPLSENFSPTLGVIVNRETEADSASYVRQIEKMGNKYNCNIEIFNVANMIDAAMAISELKKNLNCFGIIIVSDFEEATRALYDMIPPRLDVDCSSTTSIGMFMVNNSPVGFRKAPCPVVAAIKILEYENYDLAGKKVAILGRSLTTGRLAAHCFLKKDATVTVFHTKSGKINLSEYDVIVSCIGKPELITKSWFPDGVSAQYIIDIGINVNDEGKLCGDVRKKDFENTNVAITPVPGGIGKLATTILFTKVYANTKALTSTVKYT
jgi:methylenetetrahydrofolate dehydrogenase (NADP+)/methenyltetrahydrofolate cyclohydrolase